MKYKVVYHLPSGADEEEDELFYSESLRLTTPHAKDFPIIERAQKKTIC